MEEALRHRQEYDEMVAEAKKRGMLTANRHYNSVQLYSKNIFWLVGTVKNNLV